MTTDQSAELLQLLKSTTLFPPEGRQLLSDAIQTNVMTDEEQLELLQALQEEQDAMAAVDISEQVELAKLKDKYGKIINK